MHRYLPGILLAQIVTLVLFWVNLGVDSPARWINVMLPAGLVTLLTALWFASIARADAERFSAKLRADHARDREQLQLDAERSRSAIRQEAQHAITREHRRINRRANAKVGLAFAGAAAAGVLLLITEMMMLGMLTISTTGGALGGYLLRLRQQRRADALAAPTESSGSPGSASGAASATGGHVVVGDASGQAGDTSRVTGPVDALRRGRSRLPSPETS